MNQPYITIVQIWKSDTDAVPIPVLGVFPDKKAAETNAGLVALHILTESAPDLLDRSVSIVATALSDDAMREFLITLQNTRPDLLRTPRGKQRA